MRNLGLFKPYVPELPEDHPLYGHERVQFLKNEDDLDWYDLHKTVKKEGGERWFVEVNPVNNEIERQSNDITTMFPSGRILIEVDGPLNTEMLWNGSTFVIVGPGEEAQLPTPEVQAALIFIDDTDQIFRAMYADKGCVAQIQVWRQGDKLGVGRTYVHENYKHKGILSALYQHVEDVTGEAPTSMHEFIADRWINYKVRDIIPDDVLSKVEYEELPNEVFVVRHKDHIVARAQLWRHPDNPADLSIYRFYTHEAYQRRGIMTALYKHIEADRGARLIPMPLFTRTAVGIDFRKKFEASRTPLPNDPPA